MENVTLRRQLWVSVFFGTSGLLVALFYIPHLYGPGFPVFIFLVVLSTLLESMPIPLGQSLSSLLPAVPMAAMVVYGPSQAIWTVILASLLSPIILREWNWLTAFFNAGQYALSVFAMTLCYGLFDVSKVGGRLVVDGKLVLAVTVSSIVFLFFNHLFINLLQVVRGTLVGSVVGSALLADILNLALCLPFAFLMVAINRPTNSLIGPIVILPIVALAYVLRVHRQTRDLQFVHANITRLTSEFDPRTIAEETARIARRLTLADRVVIFFLDHDRNLLVPHLLFPYAHRDSEWWSGYAEKDGGVIWATIRNREFVNIPDTRRDKRVVFDNYGVTDLSMAIFPMHAHTKVQGAIVCYAKRPYAFGYSTQYVAALANQASVLFENARLYQELQERSRRDAATGLYNYRFFYEELGDRVSIAVKQQTPVSVAIVDIDFFKKFNDTYGHLAGDAVLRNVGQLLQRVSGEGAFVARYGGEEFALLLPKGEAEAYEVCERIREAVRSLTVDFHGYKLQGITVSIGIASAPEHSDSDRELLLKADSAMYWGAKQRGRNRTARYTPEFDGQLFVDHLTGLYTFHLMTLRVREEVLRGVTSWGVICVDIQHFGHINNTFGFDVGDLVLRQTGMLVRECLRHEELACRYGGDEVLILLPGVTETEVEAIKDRIGKAIAGHRFRVGENVVFSLHASAVTLMLGDVHDGADLFNRVSTLFAQLQSDMEVPLALSE